LRHLPDLAVFLDMKLLVCSKRTALLAFLIITAGGCDDPAAPAGPDALAGQPYAELGDGVASEDLARMEKQEELAPALDQVEAELVDDQAVSNVAVDPDTQRVIVYRVGADPRALQERLGTAIGAPVGVEIRSALVSRTEADSLVHRIDADQQALEAAGVKVTEWGPDGEGGPFQIGVEGDPQAAEPVLVARYPELVGRLVVERKTGRGMYGRYTDSSPYWGGDLFRYKLPLGEGDSYCSSGFGARNSHGSYMITAAHCNCTNAGPGFSTPAVFNAQWHRMGTFSSAIDLGLDAAFISAPTGADVYTDSFSKTTPAFSAVTSMRHPRVGEYVCMSGSLSRLRCGGRVGGWRHVSFSTCNGWVTVPEWFATQVHHLSLAGPGDSGGPVFVFNATSRSASARGIISYSDGSTAECAEGGFGRGCSYRMYFPDIVPIAERHNFALTGF
jgi:hypothetical protein